LAIEFECGECTNNKDFSFNLFLDPQRHCKPQDNDLTGMPIRFCASRSSPLIPPPTVIKALLLIAFLICGVTANAPISARPNPFAKVSKMIDKTESSVLGELKETISQQKDEIAKLQQQIKLSGSKSSSSHGGHGGGEVNAKDVANYLEEPFYTTSLRRVGWLGIFLASLSFTALIMNNFEHTLEKHIELSYFVPLLAGHGGNTGGQTVGTILSGMSAGIVQRKHAARIIMKEALAGVLSGCILGLVVGPVAHKVMGISYHVTMVLFLTMPLLSTIASTLGAIIPFVCVWFGLDASVIAAPAMTSIVDVTGLLAYFVIAQQVFRLFEVEF